MKSDQADALLEDTGKVLPGLCSQRTEAYYMLALFASLGTQQCYAWYTFGSMPSQTAKYFGMSHDEGDRFADLTMNYGAIVYCIVIFPCMFSLTKPNGLRRAMQLSAWLSMACCLLRWLPCVLASTASGRHDLIWMLHVAQILNAACGATYMSAASRLSAVWFQSNQRTRATAVAYCGGNAGMIMGYAYGALFSGGGSDDMPRLLLYQMITAAVPFALVLWHCPDAPSHSTLPQPIEALPMVDESTKPFHVEVWGLLCTGSLLLLVLAGGLEAGSNSAWGGLLPQIFETRYRPSHADQLANTCGILNCAGSLGGALSGGVIGDTFFKRRIKQLMLIVFIVGTGLNCLITVMFATPFGSAIVEADVGVLLTVLFMAGFFQGMLDPLLLELAAEITHPSQEGLSAGLLTAMYNVASLIVLSIAPVLSAKWMNLIYSAIFAVCTLLVLGIDQQYRRSDWEDQQEAPFTQQDLQP